MNFILNKFRNSSITQLRWRLSQIKKYIWLFSGTLIIISALGLVLSWANPNIGYPLRPSLDFTGGTQIEIQRECATDCNLLKSSEIYEYLKSIQLVKDENGLIPNLGSPKVQLLDKGESLLLKFPTLSAAQGKFIIKEINKVAGPFVDGSQSIESIGPTLGQKLLSSSLLSLASAFTGIAFYISLRYDRKCAILTLVALSHDIIIVCGVFAWLGLILELEVDSLFAVSLLTIAGYSVNDTVVVFDRIREQIRNNKGLELDQHIDLAVNATLTRTLYTSGSTLLPLLALIFFGGQTLFWFAISLAIGVVIGSWSSIALAPSLLAIWIK